MTLLPIIYYPDIRLKKIAEPITKFDINLKKIIFNMTETMYHAMGIGLAASQVDIHKQLLILDISKNNNQLQVFINPKIIWYSKEKQIYNEGCLSLPGIFNKIKRSKRIRVHALNIEGKMFEIIAEGLLAICLQHEIDHLNGKIFIEYLSNFKKERIIKKFLKNIKK
ncbi:peptide deformylase [Candidatus Profftella armatura]|uniref:Peptide deformylase n=1 Tax=Candidatus Profftella armatura TaxID=669502 RepID=S5R3Z6_9PROT|nr:peptide deformylase [Candidatus Profftella armatura]AGS06939.1 peptide deformylase [Candidatus Profftella armatura]ALC96015.1 peptide deformylase [Candidatus Profftella armatura]